MGRCCRRRKRKRKRISKVSHCQELIEDHRQLGLMVRWMAGAGYMSEVNMRPRFFAETGRGLECLENKVISGQVVIKIPHNLLITKQLALHKLGPAFAGLSCVELLSVYLWGEKVASTASRCCPYIESLPKTFNLPYLSENMAKIQSMVTIPASLLCLIDEETIRFENSWKRVQTVERRMSREEWWWVWGAVGTRSVHMRTCWERACDNEAALAPYLDLLNHSPHVATQAGYDEENKCYQIVTLTPFERHQQVFINYGPLCNRKLFINYGFVVPNNPCNLIPIRYCDLLRVCSESLLQHRLRLLHEFGAIASPSECEFGLTSTGFDWKLENLIKLLSIEKWEKRDKISLKQSIYKNNLVLDTPSRERYQKYTQTLLQVKLSEYKDVIKLMESEDSLLQTLHLLLAEEECLLSKYL